MTAANAPVGDGMLLTCLSATGHGLFVPGSNWLCTRAGQWRALHMCLHTCASRPGRGAGARRGCGTRTRMRMHAPPGSSTIAVQWRIPCTCTCIHVPSRPGSSAGIARRGCAPMQRAHACHQGLALTACNWQLLAYAIHPEAASPRECCAQPNPDPQTLAHIVERKLSMLPSSRSCTCLPLASAPRW